MNPNFRVRAGNRLRAPAQTFVPTQNRFEGTYTDPAKHSGRSVGRWDGLVLEPRLDFEMSIFGPLRVRGAESEKNRFFFAMFVFLSFGPQTAQNRSRDFPGPLFFESNFLPIFRDQRYVF